MSTAFMVQLPLPEREFVSLCFKITAQRRCDYNKKRALRTVQRYQEQAREHLRRASEEMYDRVFEKAIGHQRLP